MSTNTGHGRVPNPAKGDRTPRIPGAAKPRAGKQPARVKPVPDAMAEAPTLADFLDSAGTLTLEERKLIVRQALILMEQNYAHLPLKRAMHSVEPVHRLRLLLQTLETAAPQDQPGEMVFHRELTAIFTSVRDLHTNYLLPAPFNVMAAVLPFAVEDCWEGGKRKYIVAHVAQGFSDPDFVPGVELRYWNGMPIERAVWHVAEQYAGSNRDARHARGVQNLTVRALRIAPPPEEEWVIVGYRTLAGVDAQMRFDWKVTPPLPAGNEGAAVDLGAQAAMGLDLEQDIVRQVRLGQFAPQVVQQAQEAQAKAALGETPGNFQSVYPGTFTARPVTVGGRSYGYLRIRTFGTPGPDVFVDEFLRLIALLPQEGLIIDVRGNGGGIIYNGELLLQTLTPHRIEPEPLQFLNSSLNLEIVRRHKADSKWTDLSAWVESMQQALQSGSVYSAGFPITDPERCNDIGQRYFGPVVLVTDALCYSTTDIFAAGFQDHGIGQILGADGNTGAGGANVWEHQYFVSHVHPGKVYQPLPKGAGMRVAVRRTLRVARRAGAPLEEFGVVPEHAYRMTRKDILHDNADLIAAAGALLANQGPARGLQVSVKAKAGGQAHVVAMTRNIDRLDAYVDDRPMNSFDIASTGAKFDVPAAAGSVIELRGFDQGKLVARYRHRME